jgi:hypothetical protein
MSMIKHLVRTAGTFVLAGVATSCDHQAEVFGPPIVDPLFQRYVAVGNSITAGMQASGISDATQRQSYAFLLAQQMRTRYAYPALATPGCPAPVIDWRTGARPTGAPPCALRIASSATDMYNNTAVPDAGTTEVNAPGVTVPPAPPPYHNALTTLFLGGKTQVQRAIDAQPTFATIWIGNMDALAAATVGQLGGNASLGARALTPLQNFQTNYESTIDALVAGAPSLQGGVLVGVVQVAGAPRFFSVTAFQDATFQANFSARAGGPVGVHPSCNAAPGSEALVSFEILRAMQAGLHPRLIVCDPNPATSGVPAPVGDIFMLDATEKATLQQRIIDYNNVIQQKANEIGFAYYDPTATLAAERVPGRCIAVIPDPGAPANGSPFGSCLSNDGVHPSAAGQRLIANALIGVINEEYGTSLAPVP